jgi:hypothetical protein
VSYKHVRALLKVNKLLARPRSHHGRGSRIASFGKYLVLAVLINFIPAAVILVLTFAFIAQFSLPHKSVCKARVLQTFVSRLMVV